MVDVILRAQNTYSRKQISLAAHIVLVLSMITASIAKVPFMEEFGEIKVAVFLAELTSFCLLFSVIRSRRRAFALVGFVLLFVALRFAYGYLASGITFEQPFETSLQASRFGVMLLALPVAIFFLMELTTRQLAQYVAVYLFVLLAVDVAVFWLLDDEEILILGLRTSNRFVCSVLSALVATAMIVVRKRLSGERDVGLALGASILMLLHTSLVSTSRLESLLAFSLFAFVLSTLWPTSRWVIYFCVLGVMMEIGESLLEINAGGMAGRNFVLAVELSQRAMPFGYGTLSDTLAKMELGLPQDFFFSDYGILLYVLRYGILGLIMAIALLLYWVKFFKRTIALKGSWVLSGAILAYLVFVPVLDFGTLNGSFVLAFMWVAMNSKRAIAQGARNGEDGASR